MSHFRADLIHTLLVLLLGSDPSFFLLPIYSRLWFRLVLVLGSRAFMHVGELPLVSIRRSSRSHMQEVPSSASTCCVSWSQKIPVHGRGPPCSIPIPVVTRSLLLAPDHVVSISRLFNYAPFIDSYSVFLTYKFRFTRRSTYYPFHSLFSLPP